MANTRVDPPALAEHAEALGYLCIFFAALENTVNDLLGSCGFRETALSRYSKEGEKIVDVLADDL